MMALGLASGIIAAVISIIFGIMILVWPKLIRIGLGLYFIVIGILELLIYMD